MWWCVPQAWDPDVGESSELKYSLVESTTLLDVEASTGQVYVQDASRFGDNQFTFQVKATDKHELFTTTTLQVSRNSGRKKEKAFERLFQMTNCILIERAVKQSSQSEDLFLMFACRSK